MNKELVTIEFRYHDRPKGEHDGGHRSKTITIGVFDSFDEACIEGNKAMEKFEARFKLNPNWNRRERFSKNGGCLGSRKTLISSSAYLQTPFTFFAKITTLKYDSVDETIDEVLKGLKRYKEYKNSEQE